MQVPGTKNTGAGNRQVRQLAAIMFADMTGFTALMQDDEQKAVVLRNRQRFVLEKEIPAHNGKILQYFGDGTLSVFDSAIEAVESAIEIQRALQQDPRVLLRIGIHSGEIAYDDEGVYGDCVNLASRIEALSAPGAVLVSDKVLDEIKNQKGITSQLLGNFNLKNVKRRVDVYAITNDGLSVPTPEQTGVKAGSEKSIAVLPFLNLSADPDNEYFSEGIAEEILNALTRIDGLQVTARSSSFFFKNTNEDIRQVGAKLGVATVLTGSVRKAGNRLRTTVQLVQTADGYNVWSEVYDTGVEDIFQVQDEIASKTINRLKENFELKKKQPVIKAPTENLEAYNHYLKGRFHWNKSTPEDITKAIGCFEKAIEVDGNFALPYCALSYCYSFLGSTGLALPGEAFPKAKDYTLKAIELDPGHPESHLSLATIKFFHNWDFDGAEMSLNKALDLSLNSSLVNQVHGWFLIAKGDFEQAIQKMEQALVQDPLSLPIITNLADAYAFAGHFKEAEEQYDKAIEMDPLFRRAFEGKGMLCLAQGKNDEAIKNFLHYHELVGHPLKGLASLGHAYAMAGQRDKAQDCLDKIRLREIEEPGKVFYMDYAFIYSGMGELDKAFEYLDKTYEQRVGIACLGMIFCIRYPMLDNLKSDQRFAQLTHRMNLSH